MKRLITAALLMVSLQASALTLYVNPAKGNDHNSCSKADPCKTLAGAHSLLNAARPNEHVTIVVAAGTVKKRAGFSWKYSRPPYRVTIAGAGSSKTVFDGMGYPGTWLAISTAEGKPANITVAKIGVRNFGTAINVQGNRDDAKRGYISGVVIDRMAFGRIGGKFTTNRKDTYAAVRMVNARLSSVTNSTFTNIENAGRGDLLHAVYLAHYSSGNVVSGNSMNVVSGDPIRTRDKSGGNTISGNRLVRAGVEGMFSDWYCTGSACTKATRECQSMGNVFKNNQLGTGYTGKRIAVFKLFGSNTACGAGKRLSTAGNKNI